MQRGYFPGYPGNPYMNRSYDPYSMFCPNTYGYSNTYGYPSPYGNGLYDRVYTGSFFSDAWDDVSDAVKSAAKAAVGGFESAAKNLVNTAAQWGIKIEGVLTKEFVEAVQKTTSGLQKAWNVAKDVATEAAVTAVFFAQKFESWAKELPELLLSLIPRTFHVTITNDSTETVTAYVMNYSPQCVIKIVDGMAFVCAYKELAPGQSLSTTQIGYAVVPILRKSGQICQLDTQTSGGTYSYSVSKFNEYHPGCVNATIMDTICLVEAIVQQKILPLLGKLDPLVGKIVDIFNKIAPYKCTNPPHLLGIPDEYDRMYPIPFVPSVPFAPSMSPVPSVPFTPSVPSWRSSPYGTSCGQCSPTYTSGYPGTNPYWS